MSIQAYKNQQDWDILGASPLELVARPLPGCDPGDSRRADLDSPTARSGNDPRRSPKPARLSRNYGQLEPRGRRRRSGQVWRNSTSTSTSVSAMPTSSKRTRPWPKPKSCSPRCSKPGANYKRKSRNPLRRTASPQRLSSAAAAFLSSFASPDSISLPSPSPPPSAMTREDAPGQNPASFDHRSPSPRQGPSARAKRPTASTGQSASPQTPARRLRVLDLADFPHVGPRTRLL